MHMGLHLKLKHFRQDKLLLFLVNRWDARWEEICPTARDPEGVQLGPDTQYSDLKSQAFPTILHCFSIGNVTIKNWQDRI